MNKAITTAILAIIFIIIGIPIVTAVTEEDIDALYTDVQASIEELTSELQSKDLVPEERKQLSTLEADLPQEAQTINKETADAAGVDIAPKKEEGTNLESSSNSPMIIGGIIGATILAVLILVIIARKKKDPHLTRPEKAANPAEPQNSAPNHPISQNLLEKQGLCAKNLENAKRLTEIVSTTARDGFVKKKTDEYLRFINVLKKNKLPSLFLTFDEKQISEHFKVWDDQIKIEDPDVDLALLEKFCIEMRTKVVSKSQNPERFDLDSGDFTHDCECLAYHLYRTDNVIPLLKTAMISLEKLKKATDKEEARQKSILEKGVADYLRADTTDLVKTLEAENRSIKLQIITINSIPKSVDPVEIDQHARLYETEATELEKLFQFENHHTLLITAYKQNAAKIKKKDAAKPQTNGPVQQAAPGSTNSSTSSNAP